MPKLNYGQARTPRKRRHSCKGEPSRNHYSNGCRCEGCGNAWSKYKKERQPRGGVRRDNPLVEHDAFTREQIIKARNDK